MKSVEKDRKLRRLVDDELSETVLCEVTNKEELAISWTCSTSYKEFPLEIRCFMVQVRFVDFSEVKAWPDRKYEIRAYNKEDGRGPVYSTDSLPYDEKRPPEDLWLLADVSHGNGRYELWEGHPHFPIAVHYLTFKQEDHFGVYIALEAWDEIRNNRNLHLLPTYEVTNIDPQDSWIKTNARIIYGLVLETVQEDGNRSQRIGVFSIEPRERNKFCSDYYSGSEIKEV